MKKKNLFFLLFVMCIGYFMPTGVFASGVSDIRTRITRYSLDIVYTIQAEEDVNYVVYDKSGVFLANSVYLSDSNVHLINYHSSDSFRNYLPDFYDALESLPSYGIGEEHQELDELLSRIPQFISNHYNYDYGNHDVFWTSTGIVPMILEKRKNNNVLEKKIIFGTIHNSVYFEDYWAHKITFTYEFSLNNLNDDSNSTFMKNTSYDYSDELWNELNNMKISSSEIDEQVAEILSRTNDNKAIYSKYQSNVNYRFKVKNGNGMKFMLHDVSNTFNFSSLYDKDSDTYSIIDNSSDSDYQDGIKEFSKIIIDEVKNGNFNGLSSKYKSITSDNCSESSCNIYTYIPMILEGESNTGYAKQIVLGLVDIQYRQENGNDYYDIGLSVYNNTCDLLSNDIDVSQSELINLSRAVEKDYSSNLMNQYSDGSISMEDIYEDVDVNTLKDKYCNELPVISLRQNPKTWNSGIIVLIISMIVVIGSGIFIIQKKSVKM